ncbi:MAG TPA: histidine kinase, partial [Bacteroidia bacterium]|nr:histidine kinase [Bacteroidia bacterium]
MVPFSFVAVTSTTSYLNWRSVNRLKEKSEKENELIFRELSYYKAQFNSHFTLNFFNFCYNKTLYANSEAAKDVERFNEMLHFSLKNDSNEYVTLYDEIQYINNFICIQKCITNRVFIDVTHDFDLKNFYILPGIISTLIENSFKHGVFNDETSPIKLALFIKDNVLTIKLRNKNANRKILNSTGIGVNDLIEILKVFYPNKHNYKTDETDREYYSEITMELTPTGQKLTAIMKRFKIDKKVVLKHLTAWIGITIINAVISYEDVKISTTLIVEILGMLGFMFIYYTESLWVFPRLSEKGIIRLGLGLLAVLFIYTLILYLTFYHLLHFLGEKYFYDDAPIYVLLLNSSFLFFITSIVAYGAYLNRKTKRAIEIQTAREKALLIKQLGFLKNQFNSHIIFNFLNYCYSHIHKNSKSGAEAIELFSGMLAYTLDSNPDKPVLLEDEIEYISSYLKLQKILHDDVQIDFKVEGDLKNKFIIPQILINFIENAFKHG